MLSLKGKSSPISLFSPLGFAVCLGFGAKAFISQGPGGEPCVEAAEVQG